MTEDVFTPGEFEMPEYLTYGNSLNESHSQNSSTDAYVDYGIYQKGMGMTIHENPVAMAMDPRSMIDPRFYNPKPNISEDFRQQPPAASERRIQFRLRYRLLAFSLL